MAARTLGAGPALGCPHCGAPLAAAASSSSIDRPLQECARCGGISVRSGVNEWGLLRGGQKLACIARHAVVVLAVGAVLPLVHLSVLLARGKQWQLVDLLMSLALGVALAGVALGSRLMTRIRESRRRMRDPMYLAKLAQHQIAQATRR